MQSAYQNSFDLPHELCRKPLALVGFFGLDTINNAIHRSIWESFNNIRRSDKPCVAYKFIANDHEFPKAKHKRNSYEWYVPKGILKTNWMKKHLDLVPAVVVIFYDLEWNDPSFNERVIECSSRVQSVRATLEGHTTKIVLVLIQNVVPLPAGEDIQATERAVSICAACNLQSNALFVLPHGDHLQGYAHRLENAFFEFAQNYYHNEIRAIKGHKEHLNKPLHLPLFVRHQFKLGFLYEQKQDAHTAHKHYTYAYNTLLEMTVVNSNAPEIRTISGYLNYKLCRLLFTLSLPRDAISQFKAHVDRFRRPLGHPELAFEHHAWLSKQYHVFGEMFDDAVKMGIAPVQTQHPGLYYRQAAEYTVSRKKLCWELCGEAAEYPENDPFDHGLEVEFYGHRPWRFLNLTAEQNAQLEQAGIRALQHLERLTNHPAIIISLYGLAVQQYKTYKCPRTRRYLVLQMADEYYESKDYGKCLTLVTHMLLDLRSEKWWRLLTNTLEMALKCAFLTGSVQDYLAISLELLGKDTVLQPETKAAIRRDVDRILARQIPEVGRLLLGNTAYLDFVSTALNAWQMILTRTPLEIMLDMEDAAGCIGLRAGFTQATYEMEKEVVVDVYLRNSSPCGLLVSKISVVILCASLTKSCAVRGAFELLPGEVKSFTLKCPSVSSMINKLVQIGSVSLFMGHLEESCSLELKYPGEKLAASQDRTDFVHFECPKSDWGFRTAALLPKATVMPRSSKLRVRFEHQAPALEGEWYEMTVRIQNDEPFPINDFKIEATFTSEDGSNGLELFTGYKNNPEKLPLLLQHKETFSDKTTACTLFVKASECGNFKIHLKASYLLSDHEDTVCVKVEATDLSVVKPFKVDVKFLSSAMGQIDHVYYGESFRTVTVVDCLSPWPVLIESSEIDYVHPLKRLSNDAASKIAKITLREGESCCDTFSAECSDMTTRAFVSVGLYRLKWRRSGGRHSNQTDVPLPSLPVEWTPLRVTNLLAAIGTVRKPLLIVYNLHNVSDCLLRLELSVEGSEAFMFAGHKQMTVSVLPRSTYSLKYNLYPLITGKVVLPKLVVKLPEGSLDDVLVGQERIDALLERCLPKDIYITPQVKDSGGVDLTVRIV